MLKRFSYYLLSVVFVAGITACGGKSHDHDHDHEHGEETEQHDHDHEADHDHDHDSKEEGHDAKGAHTDEIILSVEKARAAGGGGEARSVPWRHPHQWQGDVGIVR